MTLSGERILIKKGRSVIRWFHAMDVEQILLLGNISLTAPVVTYLLKNRIDTVFLSYYGKYKGRLVGEFGKNIQRRIQQYDYLKSADDTKTLASACVSGKISNTVYLMRRRNKRQRNDNLVAAITQCRALREKLTAPYPSLDELRGYEGAAAKLYFGVFDQFLTNDNFSFNGRNRRPPRDEVNAMLSLGYTFLMNQVQTALYVTGLDPYYGALHGIEYGRESLALDLMEEFRPLVDAWIIRCVNRKEMRKEHFTYNQPDNESNDPELSNVLPVMLTRPGMRKFVLSFSSMMDQKYFCEGLHGRYRLKDILAMQAQRLSRVFEGTETYHSFNWEFGQPL